MLFRSCTLSSGGNILTHITAFTGCVGKRAYERDHITKLFPSQIPLITSGKKYYFKLGYT